MEPNNELLYKIGDILKVTTPNGDIHYEKVIQTNEEILTEDMPSDKDADISIQRLTNNWQYEIVPTYIIADYLENSIPYNIAFSIANRFYGSDYSLQRSQFDNALKEATK